MKLFSLRYLFLLSAVFGGILSLHLTDNSVMSQPSNPDQKTSPASEGKTNKDSIVVNGVEFQAILSNKPITKNREAIVQSDTFLIPKRINIETSDTSSNITKIGIGIGVTNKTDKPIYFGARADISSSVIKPNGSSVKPYRDSSSGAVLRLPPVLVQPGESVVLPLTGELYWTKNHLVLDIAGFPSGPLTFQDIEPGANQLQLTYFNDTDKVDSPLRDPQLFSTSPEPQRETPLPYPLPDLRPRRGAWRGKAVLLPVKLYLTNEQN